MGWASRVVRLIATFNSTRPPPRFHNFSKASDWSMAPLAGGKNDEGWILRWREGGGELHVHDYVISINPRSFFG